VRPENFLFLISSEGYVLFQDTPDLTITKQPIFLFFLTVVISFDVCPFNDGYYFQVGFKIFPLFVLVVDIVAHLSFWGAWSNSPQYFARLFNN
jgi:hypothetical protein